MWQRGPSMGFVWLLVVFCGIFQHCQQVHALRMHAPSLSQRFIAFAGLEQLGKAGNPAKSAAASISNQPQPTAFAAATLDALRLKEADDQQQQQDVEAMGSSPPSVGGLRGSNHEILSEPSATANPQALKAQVMDLETGQMCDMMSDCVPCPSSEKKEAACEATGHRLEISCPVRPPQKADEEDNKKHGGVVLKYASCLPPEKPHRLVHVLMFEILMGGILFVAYKALVREQKNHLSSFDLRKDPTQRRNLLSRNKERD